MIRWRDLLLAAYAPLARRHMLVEGCMSRDVYSMLPKRHRPKRAIPPHASARVVRLFAVQIR